MKLLDIPQPKCQYSHKTGNNSQLHFSDVFAALLVIVLERIKNHTEMWVLL